MRRGVVLAGLLALAAMALIPELMELFELGQLAVDLHAEWKRLR